MLVGTRVYVVGPLDWYDECMGIRVGDVGEIIHNSLNDGLACVRFDAPSRCSEGAMYPRQLVPILHTSSTPNKPRKRQEPTDTSRQALQSQKDKAPSDCAKILEYLKTHVTGRTCDHVERVLRRSHQTASARIRDLAASGKIMDSGRREKTRTGRPAICWKVVEK